MGHKLAIITDEKSELSRLFESIPGVTATYIKQNEAEYYDFNHYDSFCVLGGIYPTETIITPRCRLRLEEQRELGKRVFTEYCLSIGDLYLGEPISSRTYRLIYTGDFCHGIEEGELLDDQCSFFMKAHYRYRESKPILLCKSYINSHYKTEVTPEEKNDKFLWAMFLADKNTLVSGIPLANFISARYAPSEKWRMLIRRIAGWLVGQSCDDLIIDRAYTTKNESEENFDTALDDSINHGYSWFERNNMLINNGRDGIYEGYLHDICPDGKQRFASLVRTDCAGEAAGAYFAHYYMTKDAVSLERCNNLFDFCFDVMQVKKGQFKGMLRWAASSWSVCYQDDVARVVIPYFLKCMMHERDRHFDDAIDSLRFLMSMTGPDGLCGRRLACIMYPKEKFEQLKHTSAGYASPHFNAYYHAALLIAYKLTGEEEMKDIAIRGLTSIMSVYPVTLREQSETEELCRLILPLSWLYWITKDETHKEWLYKVTHDLERFADKSGAYYEWDTGYKAARSREQGDECSLLSENGDPVCDMLYSINWLPMAFTQAYVITGDKLFCDLFKRISLFFINSQIQSGDVAIDGAWARAFDLNLWEVYGVPHDLGWGPWCIQSGWTMSEILMGMVFGKIAEDIKKFY